MHALHLDKDLHELAEFAQQLHRNERAITMQSIHVVGELEQRRASFALGMSDEKFAKFIGLTINKYRNRVKAWRANEDSLLEGLRGTSSREAAAFIRRVDKNGIISEDLETTEFTCRFVGNDCKELERAREIIAHSGHVPSNSEILAKALREFVDRNDPMKKAQRAADRAKKKNADVWAEGESNNDAKSDITGSANFSVNVNEVYPKPAEAKRKPIPAKVRHQVRLRDGGQCTFEHSDDSRCEARMMLEFDHKIMVCRGGKNEADNIRLRCRYHNQRQAEIDLGRPLH